MFGYGVKTIEIRFDLDGIGEEAEGIVGFPADMQTLIHKVTKFKAMAGSGLKQPASTELKERFWRADPTDGLRPIKKIRGNLGL